MHDDEGRVLGDGHLVHLQGGEVDVERMAGDRAGDGQRIEQAHMRACAALGLLAVVGQREGIGVVAEGEQQRDRERGARGQPRPDRQGARDPGDPT